MSVVKKVIIDVERCGRKIKTKNYITANQILENSSKILGC